LTPSHLGQSFEPKKTIHTVSLLEAAWQKYKCPVTTTRNKVVTIANNRMRTRLMVL
jgi:hypothetical protein